MLTPQEYIDKYKGNLSAFPRVIWMDARDIMAHVLKFDIDNVLNKGTFDKEKYQVELSDGIADYERNFNPDNFSAIVENAFIKTKKTKAFDDIEGDLLIDAVLSGEEKCFENFYKVLIDSKNAITVFVNGWVSYGERNKSDLAQTHDKVYAIAAQCEAENRPLRVVSCITCLPFGWPNKKPIYLLMEVKGFDTPIFPAIWASISSNLIANAFVNCVAMYFFGSSESGNMYNPAQAPTLIVDDLIGDDEEAISFGKYIKANKNSKYKGYGDD